ncbi:MAG: pyridoxal phosphate-dependent aminotransferase, partial [Myxococcota bacterium]|nr:pyridoxal phosphate-dependent aminotransferase [Myxococcota bacterium]
PFPVPDRVVESLRRNAHQKDYLPVRGLAELRDAVAAHHRARGACCAESGVLVGPGSKELLFLLQLVFDGELVLPNPSWVSYEPQARIVGRDVAWLDTRPEEGWRLDPEALDAHCADGGQRPRVLLLNYPNNPSGTSYGAGDLEAIARVAERHGVLILSDEIYGEVHHRGEHVSVAQFYPEGTIVSGGLSKWCGAGGWRLGTFAFPAGLGWLLDAMASVASETFTSTSAPIQHAAITAFEGGEDIDSYLQGSRDVLRTLALRLTGILRGAGANVPDPEGGFYLMPDFTPLAEGLAARGIHTGETLVERALEETGVAFLPGSCFGRPEGELTARLAFVDFDGGRALKEASLRGSPSMIGP